MKKILFLVLDILLLVIICLFMFKGVQIGQKIRILSFSGIAQSNEELKQEINKAEEENQKYDNQLDTIKNDVKKLTEAKKAYLDLMTVSTDSEIQEALQTKTYSIEYLWSQIGNYATKEGVATKMEISASNVAGNDYKNLNFTISGNYLAITNFISDLENDSNLDFIIDNFEMTGSGTETCTFVVKDVKIKHEDTTVTSNNSSTPQKNSQNSNDNKSNSANQSNSQNSNGEANNSNTASNNVSDNGENQNKASQSGDNNSQNSGSKTGTEETSTVN